MKTALVLCLFLFGCSSIPGSPTCHEVRYARSGDHFSFFCEGKAGMLAPPL